MDRRHFMTTARLETVSDALGSYLGQEEP